MQFPSKTLPRWVGTFVFAAGSLFSVASWVRGKGVLMWEYIGWPEYITAIFLCTAGLVGVNWMWIDRLRPSTRFRELEPLLDTLDKCKSEWTYEDKNLGVDMARMLELNARLDDLKIKHPSPLNIDGWNYFMPILLAHSWQNKLKKIRTLWPDLEKALYEDSEDKHNPLEGSSK